MQPATSAGHLGLGVGRQHDERVLDAPVGGVGDVRDARQAVELDVVLRGVRGRARGARAGAGPRPRGSAPANALDRGARRREQLADQRVALPASAAGVRRFSTSPSRWCSASISSGAGASGCRAGRPEVGVALHDPDVAQHLVQHARRAAGAALVAQPVQQRPRRARRAGGSRSRGRRTRCSCTESRAGAARACRGRRAAAIAVQRQGCVHAAAGGCVVRPAAARDRRIVPQCSNRPRRRARCAAAGYPRCRATRRP